MYFTSFSFEQQRYSKDLFSVSLSHRVSMELTDKAKLLDTQIYNLGIQVCMHIIWLNLILHLFEDIIEKHKNHDMWCLTFTAITNLILHFLLNYGYSETCFRALLVLAATQMSYIACACIRPLATPTNCFMALPVFPVFLELKVQATHSIK